MLVSLADSDVANLIAASEGASVDRHDRERKSVVWGGAAFGRPREGLVERLFMPPTSAQRGRQ